MNIDNGHLIDLEKYKQERTQEEVEAMLSLIQTSYVAIPPHLTKVAKRELKDRAEVIVDLDAKNKLARFAARARRRRDKRRKIAKQSRRRNRK